MVPAKIDAHLSVSGATATDFVSDRNADLTEHNLDHIEPGFEISDDVSYLLMFFIFPDSLRITSHVFPDTSTVLSYLHEEKSRHKRV